MILNNFEFDVAIPETSITKYISTYYCNLKCYKSFSALNNFVLLKTKLSENIILIYILHIFGFVGLFYFIF